MDIHTMMSDSISDVVTQARMMKSVAGHWKDSNEKQINLKICEMKNDKKKRDVEIEKDVGELVSRKVPFEYLAKEWLDEQGVTLDSRAYLLEKLIPTLVMAVEKLLFEAEKRDLIEDENNNEARDPATVLFNPINFLAQFLMRNNPRYSNFAEASPYAKSIRKLLDDLKENAFNLADNNKLALMKHEARKKREEREQRERIEMFVKRGKPEALSNMFVEWTSDRGAVISLSLVQSALRSFQDYVVMLPIDVQRESMYAIEVQSTDTSGKLINIREFVEYTGQHISTLSEVSFKEFMRHMSHLAAEYRTSIEMDGIRNMLSDLFIRCDYGQIGSINRQRVLTLLNLFYDGTKDPVYKQSMRNPRKWPVVEFDEEEDEVENYIKKQDEKDEEKAKTDDEAENIAEETGEAVETTEALDVEKTAEIPAAEVDQTSDSNGQEGEVEGKVEAASDKQEANGEEGIPDEPTVEGSEGEENPLHERIAGTLESDIESNIDSEKEGASVYDATKRRVASRTEPEAVMGLSRPFSVTSATAFDKSTLNQNQFVSLLINFLGEKPMRSVVESLIRYIKAGYVETSEEREKRQELIRKEVQFERKKFLVNQLFELWDSDGSGYLEINEIEMVLAKWREEDISGHMFNEACEVFEGVFSKISKLQFHKMIDAICGHFPDEDVFESLLQFLTISVQRSFEERKRSEFRKKWMASIDFSARTSGGLIEPLFCTTLTALESDAQKHGKEKKISAYIALIEKNEGHPASVKGETVLRYVASTANDTNYVMNRILHRGMKCISFSAVDSGKPIHVPRVLNHGGIHLWNPGRRDEKIEGSFICLPLKDQEKIVNGIIGLDTLADPHERAIFVGHEISFYQGVAKSLSQALQFVDSRRKTIKVSESAVSWILRRSPNVHEVIIYLVEPALKESDGSVLRKMVTLSHGKLERLDVPPRLERKDNLFRDYLFKCIDTSETLTADAYGERHLAFPLRDSDGMVMSIVDISIGHLKQLPPHELKEIHRMLKLLEMAHKEMNSENAGNEDNMVLEVEKQHKENRIDVLFDRIMLQDLRANVGRLDARAFAEIKHYKDPPKIIHIILKAVLGIYFNGREDEDTMEKLEEWTTAKLLVDKDLVKWIVTYDPTSGDILVCGERLAACLADVVPGAVAKHGSLPAQYLFNWAFVCLSLIEHAAKMRDLRSTPAAPAVEDNAADTSSVGGPVVRDTGRETGLSGTTEATTNVDPSQYGD